MGLEYKEGDIVLENWKLIKLLGQGSYGKVYEAHREDFGITYKAAIKIISVPSNESEIQNVQAEGMDDASMTDYFRGMVETIVSEFGLMSRLKGTANIVSYEDHAVVPHKNGIGWDILIRMELLTPMLDYMSRHQMMRRDIIQLGMDLCRGLELCQKYNIIHRDIKPGNIFISEAGDYKLGDFGVARTLEKTTGGLSKKGTYTYMAPEVYREEPYGSTVDIYSLGIVMYRLLNNNRAPFLPQPPAGISYSDREKSLVRRISGEPLPSPANADGRLAEIVLKACAYDPKDRYSSPVQMRQELEAILYKQAEDKIVNRGQDPILVSKTDFRTVTSSSEDETVCVQEPPKPHQKEIATSADDGEETIVEYNQTPPEKKKKKFGSGIFIVAAIIFIGVALLFTLPRHSEKREQETLEAPSSIPVETMATETKEVAVAETELPETLPTEAEIETEPFTTEQEDIRWKANILKKDNLGSNWDNAPVYGSAIQRKQIVSVTFLDSVPMATSTSWDVSEAGDGSVLAWVNGDGQHYDLFIGAEGGINGVRASQELFANYTSLEQIHFNDCFHTEQTESMERMFYSCTSLTNLDLSSLETSNVTEMNCMFERCYNLQKLDLSTFDTSKVTNMAAMFADCWSLTELDLHTFDTSNVLAMHYMFFKCESLETLDLQNFDTGAVEKMANMFENCTSLKDLDISSFDTSSVRLFQGMFLNCPNLADINLSHFDTSKAKSFYYFMDEGREANGKPWQDMFKKS